MTRAKLYTYQDKYGKYHPTEKERDFANTCYQFMQFLTDPDPSGLNIPIFEAEKVCAAIIQDTQDGMLVRQKFNAFIHMTNTHFGWKRKD